MGKGTHPELHGHHRKVECSCQLQVTGPVHMANPNSAWQIQISSPLVVFLQPTVQLSWHPPLSGPLLTGQKKQEL